MMKMSYHAHVERFDRIVKIVETVGIGEIVASLDNYTNEAGRKMSITTTGIALIIAKDDNSLITAFAPDIDLVTSFFRSMGWEKMPTTIYRSIMKNRKMGLTKL